eukprot:scaffold73496_cov18-Tisochrysis_lutea.AAC.1
MICRVGQPPSRASLRAWLGETWGGYSADGPHPRCEQGSPKNAGNCLPHATGVDVGESLGMQQYGGANMHLRQPRSRRRGGRHGGSASMWYLWPSPQL